MSQDNKRGLLAAMEKGQELIQLFSDFESGEKPLYETSEELFDIITAIYAFGVSDCFHELSTDIDGKNDE